MSIGSTIARNTVFNIAGRVCEAILGLILIRYVWTRIGASEYGLWALLAALTGYVSLLDFGISSAYAKFIAEHAARKEDAAISGVVTTGLVFYALFGALIVAVAWPMTDLGLRVLESWGTVTATGRDEVQFLLRGSIVLYAASACIGPFSAVQAGLQRMDITNALGFASSLVRLASTVAFLETGHGLRGMLYASAVTLGFFGFASACASFILWPALRVGPRNLNARTFKRLFGFGWKTQVAKLANLIMFETDKLVVGLVFGRLDMVGLYDLGVGLANKFRQAPVLLFSALMPAAAELDARGEDERLRELYLRSTKYVAIATIPLLLFAVASADQLMRVWMGPGFERSAWVLRIIALGYIANILPGAGVSIALGKGRPDMQMNAGLISMIVNIVLTIILYLAIGFWGIPIATSVSMIVSCLWFILAVEPIAGVGLRRLFRDALLWPTVTSLPGFVVCAAIDYSQRSAQGIAIAVLALSVSTAIYAASFLLLFRLTPFLDAFDRRFLEETLKLGRVPGYRWWARSGTNV
jgi:O-antigen/teichoic acid export membrane protein